MSISGGKLRGKQLWKVSLCFLFSNMN